MPGERTHVEPVEQMAEAALVFATADAATMTCRITTSGELIHELGREVRNLDGSRRAP
jgi:hypothetical protein